MCSLTAAAVGSSVATVGAQAAGSSRARNQTARFENARYSSVATSALEAQLQSLEGLNTRAVQETFAASQQSEANRMASESAQGAAIAQAASRGVSGVSLRDLVDEYQRIESGNEFVLQQNLGFLQRQLDAEARGVTAQTQARISGAAPSVRSPVSPLALGLQMGSVALNGYALLAETAPPKLDDDI